MAHVYFYRLIRPQGYKTFSMLNSTEHEISIAQVFIYQEIQLFSGSDKPKMLFILLINVKMPLNNYEQ